VDATQPRARPDRRRRLDFAVAGGCLLGAAAIFWVFRDLRHDDAFITFRYARNLVRGTGFTFNPGERIFGTTTPLFTLISALLCALVGDAGLPTAAVAVNALAVGAQALLLYLLLRERLPWTALAVAALTLLGVFGLLGWLALETNTFAALVLATVWALARRRPVACGIALGLAFLTRYDAALLVPLVPLWLRREGWRRAVTPLLVAAVPVVPWLLFAWLYFGSPLPNSLGAKTGITPWREYLGYAADRFLRLPGVPDGPIIRLTAGLVAAVGLLHLARWARELAPLMVFALSEVVVYAAIGPSKIQTWHLYVPQLAFTLLILLGLFATCERIGEPAPWLPTFRRWRLALVAATAILLVRPQAAAARDFAQTFRNRAGLGGRDARYVQVADWVRSHLRSRPTFLAPEVGTLGYLTDARMIDPYGLVSPIHGYERHPSAAKLAVLIERLEPDTALVDSPTNGRRLEEESDYRMVEVFPWIEPAPTLLVRRSEVLRDPGELAALNRAAAAVADEAAARRAALLAAFRR
jgi:arabinofuranosyltransferase